MTTPARPDLLRRVTSAGKAPPPPAAAPKPAAPPLNKPFPVGQIISTRDPAGLTPFEREQLAAAGVNPTDPIPANMAEILEQVRAEATSFLPPPVDPNRPPLQVRTVQEHEMTPAQRAEVRAKVEAALRAEAESRARAAEAAAEERLEPGVRAGLLQARMAKAQAAPPPQASRFLERQRQYRNRPTRQSPFRNSHQTTTRLARHRNRGSGRVRVWASFSVGKAAICNVYLPTGEDASSLGREEGHRGAGRSVERCARKDP